ncbi:MAG: NOL1/NOP2/sun family putative RNA methylase [Candidatus Pacearchaeota archaeon]
MSRRKPEPKEKFLERMKELSFDEEDYQAYLNKIEEMPLKSLRCNTLKISPEELRKNLEEKGWKISQPWKSYPEVMIVENELEPGEIGRTFEALLGYYYIQELASLLPVISMNPEKEERVLDLCASPGSKSTQIAAKMENTGSLLSNDMGVGRMKILVSNIERCGVTNAVMTSREGVRYCQILKENGFQFDKILLDVPCTGEGTYRSNPAGAKAWNPNGIKSMSKIQKKLFQSAFEILKPEGEIIYSTCTHGPEENEEVVDFALKELGERIEILDPQLPSELNYRNGITSWQGKEFDERVSKTARLHPQDSNTEGFFVSKFKKVKP